MHQILYGNAMVGQSGGPTAAINATLSGVIRAVTASQAENGPIRGLYGLCNGIEGLQARRWIRLSERCWGEEDLRLLEQTPAAALGSCRNRLPNPDSDSAEDIERYEAIFRIFREEDIRYFFYIGGNDSMDTVDKLDRYAKKIGYALRVMGIPKTIDNDLPLTDHTPGYGSAAKYIATAIREVIRDCSVYTTKSVTVVELMGRDAGWLTAASAIGRLVDGQEPDLVYLPERAFDMERFFSCIEALFVKKNALVIAVSEGIRFADGRYVGEGMQSGVTDVFGHRYLAGTGKALERAVKERFGCKVRSMELNLTQRCAGHWLSLTDLTEAVRVGSEAVRAAMNGHSGEMMIFRRQPGDAYACDIACAEISLIANQSRYLPDDFINDEANHVTDACCRYLLPLIEGEYQPICRDGLPVHLILSSENNRS